jgi:hypothetical protein
MNAGLFAFVGLGRIKTTTGLPTHRAPNAVPVNDGNICLAVGMSIVSWVSGIPYGTNGRIVAQTSLSVPVAYYHAGLGFTAAGRLACDSTGAIASYVRGIPMTAEGRVAIVEPLVEFAEQEKADHAA